jgi:hypothetical protein
MLSRPELAGKTRTGRTMSSGYGIVPASQGHLRASSADRERAIDVLKAGFAEGRLDQDEYSDRVELVYRSKTYAELAVLVGDLPIGPLGSAVLAPPGSTGLAPVAWQAPPVMFEPAPVRYRAGPVMLEPAQHVPRTSNMAIAAMILGLGAVPTMGVTALPAIVLGVVSFVSTGWTGDRGKLMATVGVIFGAIGLPLLFNLLTLGNF